MTSHKGEKKLCCLTSSKVISNISRDSASVTLSCRHQYVYQHHDMSHISHRMHHNVTIPTGVPRVVMSPSVIAIHIFLLIYICNGILNVYSLKSGYALVQALLYIKCALGCVYIHIDSLLGTPNTSLIPIQPPWKIPPDTPNATKKCWCAPRCARPPENPPHIYSTLRNNASGCSDTHTHPGYTSAAMKRDTHPPTPRLSRIHPVPTMKRQHPPRVHPKYAQCCHETPVPMHPPTTSAVPAVFSVSMLGTADRKQCTY